MGLHPVAPGDVAAVVTTLEMTARPDTPAPPPAPLDLRRRDAGPGGGDLEGYRELFRRVGAPWLWYSRLAMDDARLAETLGDPAAEVYAAVDADGRETGLLELAFRRAGECELAYFALEPELVGRGLGRWLMAHALRLGWRDGVGRMWVNTCSLDHPRALPFYRAAGFRPVSRTVETFPDPRLSGLLPPDAAPQVPCLPDASPPVRSR